MSKAQASSLRVLIETAVSAGYELRAAREREMAAQLIEQARLLEPHIDARVAEVMAALPGRITEAVAGAPNLPTACMVMKLADDEFGGVRFYDSCYGDRKLRPYPGIVRRAAAVVFDQLVLAGYVPTLHYRNPCAAGFDSFEGHELVGLDYAYISISVGSR